MLYVESLDKLDIDTRKSDINHSEKWILLNLLYFPFFTIYINLIIIIIYRKWYNNKYIYKSIVCLCVYIFINISHKPPKN